MPHMLGCRFLRKARVYIHQMQEPRNQTGVHTHFCTYRKHTFSHSSDQKKMAMPNPSSSTSSKALAVLFLGICFFFFSVQLAASASAPFQQNFVVSWAPSNVKFLDNGQVLQLYLDSNTGAGFSSKDSYLFGNIDMQIKLVPGNSAGTVTAYYLSSETANHDELDFEFLGNVSGEPYILQTNVFASGVGGREQRIFLWFDPTADFHTYSVSWTKQRIVFLVDGVPIRVYSDNEGAAGVPYPGRQPMRVFSSIWNGDSWATRGGAVKIDWSHAPFVASYRGFDARAACAASTPAQAAGCESGATNHVDGPGNAAPAPAFANNNFDRNKLQWVKSHFMVYDYCQDRPRYAVAPAECSREL